MKNKKLIVISGPTACGKTSTSIKLAAQFNGEIINFDSLLFYKELNIGSAKPNTKEQQGIAHHLVSTHSIYSPINAADFLEEALPIIQDCHARDKNVFLVGGSGFYLQTILKGMYNSSTTSPKILDKSNELYAKEGITPFLQELKSCDPESYKRYHENDHYRIRRAVEHYWMNGNKFSDARENMKEKELESPLKKYNWDALHIYLDIPKEEHFPIIQKRTKQMIEQGLINEVEELLKHGATGGEKPLNSIGYKEIISYIKGEFANLGECMERISINTRRLAKSQRTWFKKVEKLCYNPLKDQESIKTAVQTFLKD